MRLGFAIIVAVFHRARAYIALPTTTQMGGQTKTKKYRFGDPMLESSSLESITSTANKVSIVFPVVFPVLILSDQRM